MKNKTTKATPAAVAAFVARIKPIVDVMWNTYGVGDAANSILAAANDELVCRAFSGVSVGWSVERLAEMEAAAEADIAKHRSTLADLQAECYHLYRKKVDAHNFEATKGLDRRKKVKPVMSLEEYTATLPTF